MKQWAVIALFAGVVLTSPHQACAQASRMPVIGLLHPGSPERFGDMVAAFRNGLGEHGFVEGENLKIEYRWAEGCRPAPPPPIFNARNGHNSPTRFPEEAGK